MDKVDPIASTLWTHDAFTIPSSTPRTSINEIVDRRVESWKVHLREQGWTLRGGVSLTRESAGDGLSLINMTMKFDRTISTRVPTDH